MAEITIVTEARRYSNNVYGFAMFIIESNSPDFPVGKQLFWGEAMELLRKEGVTIIYHSGIKENEDTAP